MLSTISNHGSCFLIHLSDIQSDLPKLFASLKTFLCGSCVLEREGGVEDRLELAGHHEVHHGAELAQGAHGRADDGQVAANHVAVVDLELRTAGVAHG